ncbi:hypothetical protein [Hydrogenimonas sp.]
MKKRVLFTLLLLCTLGMGACADKRDKTDTKEEHPMKPSILKERPSFLLDIACEKAPMRIYLNGIQLFEDFSKLPISLKYPVNDIILDGDNELTLLIDKELDKGANCEIGLIVREFNNFEMIPKRIVTLHYEKGRKKPTEGTTPPGRYSSLNDFAPSEEGDVHVGTPVIKEHKKSDTYEVDALFVSLKFSLPTPFGRWKFASGRLILDKPYLELTKDEALALQKHDPKLAKLYEINHQIYKLVKAKDIDGLMAYFKERNEEMDRAYFHTPGTTEKILKEKFEKALNDPDMKLWEISEERWKNHKIVFRVDENNRLAWLTDLIIFNYTKGEGSATAKMKFRWDGNTWILTR